ncbi:TlpA family protein disulfide reductase [Gilvimarinus xylanilyticus]|uniref:TlpA family protein disulfide reductase n=1 Tax=Gilvimarinus xylanilyticus TaxID=2944139 RepID=A0A9X2I581_9GAMM|nr:TlpA disulfide reductase family protein [Gilvimarinus xylanilyticus]MCP8899677.1 TlpA family protein disulfide reductase [Gilvimarinus xylanilyticus]
MTFWHKTLLAITIWVTATGVQAQQSAPDFTLKSTTGDNQRLAEQRGNVVMLNFWASWCAPCRKEMPLLDELYQRYQDAGFVLYGINVESDTDAADKLLEDIPVSFPVLYDPTSKVSELYGVDAMPTTILIDRDGNIRHTNRGYRSGDEEKYRKQIKELIRE